MKHFLAFILVGSSLAAGALQLHAQEPAKPIVPQNEQLEFGSVTLYSENDKYFAGTDQHYTNGFKLSFLTTDLRSFTGEPVPSLVRTAARKLGTLTEPDAAYKLNLSIGQNLYTPVNTRTTAYQPDDRPYAAWLYVGAAYQNYLPERRTPVSGTYIPPRLDVFEITVGTVGPAALGRQVQNGFHNIIGVAHANGWSNQIHNEAGLNLVFERKYRLGTAGTRDGFGADFIPHGGFSAGNIFTYANLGFEVRTGWKLPADFGTNLIRPSSDSNSTRRPDWSAFLFGAVDGRAVARDITLDGNTFHDSPHITKDPYVADWQVGLALGTRRFQITYSQAVRTHEYKNQRKASVFGSISGTFYY
jgi:lipid A 3-O-deacylase